MRNRENTRYIKTNNPVSAYALYILNSRHEHGNADQTIQLLQLWNKGSKMNCWESFYIHIFKQQNTLIDDQKVNDLNQLYTLANVTRRQVTQLDIHLSSVLTTPAYRQHQHRVSPLHKIIQPLCLYFRNPYISTLYLSTAEYPDYIYGQ